MNLRSTIFTLMLMSYALSSTEKASQQSCALPTINITVHTANRADLHQVNDLTQQATQKNEMSIQNPDDTKIQQLYNFLDKHTERAHSMSLDFFTWMEDNKIKTGCLTIALIYGWIALRIHQANAIINDANSWSNWHHTQKLEDLFATPQSQLESDLLFAIQTKYVHPVNPTDFIYSIVQSSISLKAEITIIQNQIWRYEKIAQCQCLPLFFIEPQDLENLKESMRKLLFIQHLLSSWCARYKIDKNN